MAMNEIALFKGVRIQPYQKYIDFMFAGIIAFIFLIYRIYSLFSGYKAVNKKWDILTLFEYFKPHLLYLLIGTAIIFVICKLIAQFLIRFKT
ncbi:TPA: cell division protein FtsK, partial [Staphylococcus aureus]|nr:cell division protein FtsK [Staphylococcus aureus]HDM0308154.1 cell division protein FtsK [Staphylococcus aureus]HDM1362521.1 cell division protein FtsK [Staphylococcus aureus]HDM1376913.1 cell division protein FtsK [Staphylococcus aureus]HDM2005379.1 cell division protein FtsK [Staphylococcus aureus]